MDRPLRVLLIEDSTDDAELMVLALRRDGLDPSWERVETIDALKAALDAGPWDAILCDYTLPAFGASAALEAVRAADPDLPFLVVSGTVGEEVAVGMMRDGANDYVLKQNLTRLAPALGRELREASHRRASRAADRLAQDVLDSLPSHVAVLDAGGTIIRVNTAWERFAEANGAAGTEACGVGANYLEVCGRAAARRSDEAGLVAGGILQVLRGEVPAFSLEYPCHSAAERRWYMLQVTPLRPVGQGAVVSHTDISGRKQAEDSLRAGEARLRSFVEHVSAPIAMLDREMRYLHVSRRWMTDYQLGDRDITGLSHYEVFPDLPQGWKEIHQRCLGGAIDRCDEVRFERGDGTVQWIRWEVRPWTLTRGDIGGIIMFTEDITERKQSEVALRASEERYRQLADAMPQIVWVTQPDGYHEFYNRQWYDYTGLTFGETEGEGWNHVFHPEDQPLAWARWRHALATGEPYEIEYRCRRHDGEYRWFLGRALPQRGESGEVIRWFGTCTDIHDFKRAEAVRAEVLARLTLQVERMPLAYLLTDADSRYTRWNPAAARTFGFTEAEVLGKRPSDRIVPPQSAALVAEIFARLAAGDMDAHGTCENVTKDGRTIVCEWHNTPLFGPEGAFQGVLSVAQDVTGRKWVEEALRTSEERYRTLIATSTAIVWNSPPSGAFDSEQPGWTAFTGQTVSQHRGWGWLEAIHPDDREHSGVSWAKAVEERSSYEVQHRLRRADGEYRQMTARAVPIFAPSGAIREWVGVHTDVTEQRRAEEALKFSEARYRRLFEAAQDGILLIDPESRKVNDVNPFLADLVGYTRDELVGKELWQIGLFRDIDSNKVAFETLQEAGYIRYDDLPLQTKDGRHVAVEFVSNVYDVGGSRVIQCNVRDISARKRVEDALRLRDRAIQAATQGFVITDAGQPDDPIVYVSPGGERITGYKEAEMLGRNCRLLQGKDTDPAAVARVREAVRAGQSCMVELLNYRKDRSTFWNEMSVSPIYDAVGVLTHFVGVLSDVTARRSLEEQLRQAQKMDAFGQLAGGVAHDFNNLLTIINGYSDLLLQRLPAADPYRGMVAEIHKAGERSAGLTRQLLAFSRQQILAPQVLDLNGVVAETNKMLRRLIGEDIRLTTTAAPGLWLVQADPGQVEQLLMNLAVNARDAMPRGGQLTVETRNEDLDESYARTHPDARPGPHVLLSVTDTGAGMSLEVKARIFEPFFTTKEAGKGTGLGLATVYGIVKQSGGHVAVYSELGVGTTFKVYLPRVEQAAKGSGVRPGLRTAPRGSETVLLAEDEDGVRTLTRHVLAGCGYTVLEAADGEGAVRLAGAHPGPIHLLITDVVMPGAGGRAAAEQVARRHPGVRVLFMSGYTDDAVIRHGVLREGVNFLQKPFTPLALAVKVREVLDGPAGDDDY